MLIWEILFICFGERMWSGICWENVKTAEYTVVENAEMDDIDENDKGDIVNLDVDLVDFVIHVVKSKRICFIGTRNRSRILFSKNSFLLTGDRSFLS